MVGLWVSLVSVWGISIELLGICMEFILRLMRLLWVLELGLELWLELCMKVLCLILLIINL